MVQIKIKGIKKIYNFYPKHFFIKPLISEIFVNVQKMMCAPGEVCTSSL